MYPAPLVDFEHISRHRCVLSKQVKANVLPGQFYISKQDEVIITILGSCIAVCLQDSQTGIVGMNHFLLPSCDGSLATNTNKNPVTFYGQWAMECLINGMMKHGAKRKNLEAKIFGGAHVTKALPSYDIGQKNYQFAQQYLANENIPVISDDTGGPNPRRIFYYVETRKVEVHNYIKDIESVVEKESNYLESVEHAIGIDIQFF